MFNFSTFCVITFQNEYDISFSQQQFNPPSQYGQASNFSRFNDSAYPGINQSFQQGLKRSAPIDPWQGGPLKRVGARGRLGPPPQPLMHETYRSPRPVANNSSGTRRIPPLMGRASFIPNKVVKSKSAGLNKPGAKPGSRPGQGSAPNKLNAYPVSVRQNLVAKASDLTQKASKEEKFVAGKPVSRSLMGRLELALGTVFKDMKQKYGEVMRYSGIFRITPQQRVLKQAIRERIRELMLGKNVGTAPEIIKIYYDKYPVQHDEEILQLALKAAPQHRSLPFKATITGSDILH